MSSRTETALCPETGKRRLSRKDAMRQAAWWRVARFAPMQHYKCRDCDAWHIGNAAPRRPKRW